VKPHIPGRWHAQGLDAPRFRTGAEVVRHLGAVQSQLHDMSLWAIGRRCGRSMTELQSEFDALAFRRTHVLRPTWHHVDLPDLYRLQALTAPRVHRLMAGQRRELDIDDDLIERARLTTTDALASGPLTRDELAEAWAAAGITGSGRRTSHLAAELEIACVMASGPMRGRQHTYALIDPPATGPVRDDLLAELATTYGRGHGPFRAKDLAWWSSLTLTDARRAVMLAALPMTTLDGDEYALPREPLVEAAPPAAALLSNFDEYISYARDEADYARISGTVHDVMRSMGLLFLDGALGGLWRRTVKASTVRVDVIPDTPLSARARHAVEAEAERFADFLGRTLDLGVEAA